MRGFLLLLTLLTPLGAWAGTQSEFSVGSLDWHRYDWQYQAAAGPVTSHVTALGISIDDAMAGKLRWGITFGLTRGDQTGNTDNPGARYGGQFGDLHLRGALWSTEYLDLDFAASYGYYTMDSDDNDQHAKLHWTETDGRLGVKFKLGDWRLGGGVYRWRQDGEYTVTSAGRASGTTDLNSDWQSGNYAGLEYYTDPTGYIRLEVMQGDLDATTIRFVREF